MLEQYLINKILTYGPISLEEFMRIALTHDPYGYYMKQSPIGKNGDFITAPELSQIFGELIALFTINYFTSLPNQTPINIVELGAGKATLLQDFILTVEKFPTFFQNTSFHIVEISPYLTKLQQEILFRLPIKNLQKKLFWYKNLDSLKLSTPTMFIANEFFDALPIKQYQKKQFPNTNSSLWYEIMLGVKNMKLSFMLNSKPCLNLNIPIQLDSTQNNTIFETCNIAKDYLLKIIKILKKSTGKALIIDYGYEEPQLGSSLQAMKQHALSFILNNIGNQDLSYLVNFADLKQILTEENIIIDFLTTQRDFLLNLGFTNRLNTLSAKINNNIEKTNFIKATDKLINPKDMGSLFKVLSFSV